MEEYISRYYSDIEHYTKPNSVLVIYGARQVGKTTLLKHYLDTCPYRYKLDSGDNIAIQALFTEPDFKIIQDYVAGYELLVLDEAQRIPNLGLVLKSMVDHIPNIRIIVTGSSSFELAGQIGEPLTGRKRTLTLYPIAYKELRCEHSIFELRQHLSDYLMYGTYPAVLTASTPEDKRRIITEITESYLLKDLLAFDKIKNAKVVLDLLRLIAFQVGHEVSHTELGTRLHIDNKTVARYLDLFEKGFVLYNLRGFSRNLRNEVTKKSKYYFYDIGIRNALIANFNTLDMRDDVGQLWENFLFIERLKKQSYEAISVNRYFWRTWSQKEIDLIEECDGMLHGYEFKWGKTLPSAPKEWIETYPNADFTVINQNNFSDFIT